MNLKRNKFLIIFLIFLFSLFPRFLTLNQIGRTWDESIYVEQGYKFIELFKKGDLNNSFFYTTYDHPPLVKYLYGITAHLDVEKIDSNGEPVFKYDFTYSRVLSLIVFSIGVIFVVLIGWEFISPLCGVIAGIILSLLPFSLGLSQLVTAESMKIFIYPLVIYVYIKLLEKTSIKKLILSGVLTGIAVQIKQTNILLVLIFVFMCFFRFKCLRDKEKMAFMKKSFLYISLITIFTIFFFFLIWPQGILHLSDLHIIHSKLWKITTPPPEIFLNRLVFVPKYYYFFYFLITIPIIILGFFFLGIYGIWKNKRWEEFILLAWFFVPFLLSFYFMRQHGLRYIIEIYPPISLIAAVGFNTVLEKLRINNKIGIVIFLPVLIYMCYTLFKIKPYYLDYFNEVVGGTCRVYAQRMFPLGWWGQGVGEAGKYLSKVISSSSKIGIAVSPGNVVPPLNQKVNIYRDNEEYDYVIVNYYNILREGFDDRKIKIRYKPVYFVHAGGAVLVTVYKHK